MEASVANRGLAIVAFAPGEFAGAQSHCERAIAASDPERNRETRERFSEDTGLDGDVLPRLTMWQLGEVDRARELIEGRTGAPQNSATSRRWPIHSNKILR